MRITGTVITVSEVSGQTIGSRIERTAHKSMTADVRSERTRAHVEMHPDGSVTVTTFRLAAGADPRDPDPIVWNEDATLHLPASPERPALVQTLPNTSIIPVEAMPI